MDEQCKLREEWTKGSREKAPGPYEWPQIGEWEGERELAAVMVTLQFTATISESNNTDVT